MLEALVLLPLAGAASYFGVAGVRRWALHHQALDIPNLRSSHFHPTPRGGGLAVVLVTILGWVILGILFQPSTSWTALATYAFGASLIALVSWFDDLYSLSVATRFAAHSLGALVAIVCLRLLARDSAAAGTQCGARLGRPRGHLAMDRRPHERLQLHGRQRRHGRRAGRDCRVGLGVPGMVGQLPLAHEPVAAAGGRKLGVPASQLASGSDLHGRRGQRVSWAIRLPFCRFFRYVHRAPWPASARSWACCWSGHSSSTPRSLSCSVFAGAKTYWPHIAAISISG